MNIKTQVIDNEGNAVLEAGETSSGVADLIRVVRETSGSENSIEPQKSDSDQKAAESTNTNVDELALDSKDEDDDRNKRYK